VTQEQGKPDSPAPGDENTKEQGKPDSPAPGDENTKEHGKPDSPVPSDENTREQERDKADVPVWLQVVVGVLAILAFLGIANYHQLATALGWQKIHTTSRSPSPSPSLPPIVQDPVVPQDAATCTSALSDIHTLQSEIPAHSDTAESQFYFDQSETFNGLAQASATSGLKIDLELVRLVALYLALDYRHAAQNDPAGDHSAYDLSELRVAESGIESFCSHDLGITG
jgi:hypothetical protein